MARDSVAAWNERALSLRTLDAAAPVLHAALVVCAAWSALCLLFFLANVLLLPRLSREAPAGDAAPFLSIVVPARDEERAIGPAVSALLAQDYPRFEVIVVDDRSTDATAEILARLAAADPRLVVVAGEEPPAGWIGKPHALHQGARAARGEILLFVDADVLYGPTAVGRAVGYLERERADFAALLPAFETQGFWEPVLMANLACAVFLGPGFLANADRPRWLAVGGGAGNLVRRRVYAAVGGHDRLRASVVDDVRLASETKRAGFRVRALVASDHVRVRMYHGFREVWDGFTKNTAYVLGGWTGVGVFLLALLWTAVSVLPAGVLAAVLLGAPFAPRDAALAAEAWGILVAARVLLALYAREHVWTALTQPLMALVWIGILARSLFYRLVRRTLTWRGRSFDARKVGF